jgi:hypothetical protein
MSIHSENFVTVRQLLPRMTSTRKPRTTLTPPLSKEDLQYQQLLSEANLSFNMREFAIALDGYLSLREKILVQSHPELPGTSGIGTILGSDVWKVDISRIVELSRQMVAKLPPGNPVTLPTPSHAIVDAPRQPFPPFSKLGQVTLDHGLVTKGLPEAAGKGRMLIAAGALDAAMDVYDAGAKAAEARGDLREVADLTAEKAAMRATYAQGAARPQALRAATTEFRAAAGLYGGLGDDEARNAMTSNLAAAERDAAHAAAVTEEPTMRFTHPVVTIPGIPVAGTRVAPASSQLYLTRSVTGWDNAHAVAGLVGPAKPAERNIGWYAAGVVTETSLDPVAYSNTLLQKVYAPRVNAKLLEEIDFLPHIDTNFVAYLPHLYFYVLPVSIGDTYLAMGRYGEALAEYRAALGYPYLNVALEAPSLWQKMARTYLAWGKELFRQQDAANAKAKLETIILTVLSLPSTSELYAAGAFTQMQAAVGEVVHLLKEEAHGVVNPQVAGIVIEASKHLANIAAGLDYYGVGPNTYPIFRFKYLQSVANYLADGAVQAERTFIQFRSTAEQQKLERIQLETNVEMNKTAVQIEQARLVEANDELTIANETKQYADDRAQHAQDALDDWNTIGYEASRQDWYLTWAANSGNDKKITFTNALYEGERHDFNSVPARDFIATIAKRRDQINWEIQRNKLENQLQETGDEQIIAQSRIDEAKHRITTQKLNIALAQQRLAGSQEALEYSRDRMFNEEMWFQLAAQLQDLSRQYLDYAIYTARLTQRAYQIEFDRDVSFIRTDYGIGGVDGLLGGDYLKRDIAQLTVDALRHQTKTNPIRLVLSLRNEFPAQFEQFRRTGVLPFTTDLELFDRPYPGTFRRKLKKVEVFVEGLLPPEGASGFLIHQGLCKEWRFSGGNWTRSGWVVPAERMALSSYQFRRDLSIFQPSEEVTGLFENYGPQGNWTLSIPPASNNVDYQAITDIQMILYLTADFDTSLAAKVATTYPQSGGRVAVLSSRFYYPDEYFRLDVEKSVTFTIDAARFPANYTALAINGFAVTLLDKAGTPMNGVPLTVTRASDSAQITGTTGADGSLAGDKTTLAPYAAWKGATPIDAFTVAFGSTVDTTTIGDVQLALGYGFTYRS